jgi:hypothetical protein
VRLDGPADPVTGLQYSREISLGADSPRISFHAMMKNATGHPIRWSMQSVSQYNTSDAHNPAEYNHQFWAFAPVNPASAYFNKYQVRAGLADDPSFAVSGSLFKLHWLYLENEVWLDSSAGWLAVVDADSQFAMVERFRFVKGADYPGKASLIFYKNGAALGLNEKGRPELRSTEVESTPYYMEAEVNSPMIDLQPGESYAMDTNWWPTRADGQPRANPALRFALPPFGADVDSLRQFEGATHPQIRLIPVPLPYSFNPSPGTSGPSLSAAAVSLQFTNVFQIATTALANSKLALAGGGFAPVTVPLVTGAIVAGDSFVGSVQMARSFQLLSLTADTQCEIRIYGTALAQSFDNARAADDPVPAEITSDIISSVSLDTAPFAWGFQNRIGANQDTPQAKTIYVSVFNTDVDVANINISISYLPLESSPPAS